MRRTASKWGLATALFALVAHAAPPAPKPAPAPKLITIGPAITQTVFALGAGDRVVGVDDSSAALPEASKVRTVGYQRALSAEGVLSLGAGLLLGSAEAGPPPVLEQLKQAGMKVETFANEPTVEGARARIQGIAERLGTPEQGKALVAKLDADLKKAADRATQVKGTKPPRILAIYARGAGTMMVAGSGTVADTLIRLTGGMNAADSLPGYKPLGAEAVVAAAPEFVLLPASSVPSVGGAEGLAKLPGLSQVKGWKLVTVEDVDFMGLGPNLGQAVARVQDALAPASAPAQAPAKGGGK
ncbi:ABC transporter substrate-binding protein [Corallococcus exiguus]|uniref:heme/hemin ABC transporter substrate-binding protein n=1 Tax=Corallococcus TaxID=83461 RepID=UPI000EA3507D|nr:MULTISPECIES: ABC transporter substrate-binding protein [Corallococcus]NNC18389.1 ABC transporter substrate-binding protein [Corallococcus exiguus]RKH16718.1 hemin ABC transporter substrate-binding protein [Corallococcus sp. CA041A]RKH99902.1 hemin ABC transporter substrate-binding protein [Corallococcus sp. AB030]RUO95135.1 hemin ABC transporter substrate-binding protein [Corallococcus sp. AB018]